MATISLAIILRPNASAPKKYMISCSKEKGAKLRNRKFIFVKEALVKLGPKTAIIIIKIKKIIEMKASLSFKNIDNIFLKLFEDALLL